MGRILAIDFGQKRCGLAVTDPLQIIANALETVPTHLCIEFIKKYCQKDKVDNIVIGDPKTMKNEASESVKYLTPFINRLKKEINEIPIVMIDERFTSKMAFQTMIDSGINKKARQNKALIDTISATIILQSYLEQKNNKLL